MVTAAVQCNGRTWRLQPATRRSSLPAHLHHSSLRLRRPVLRNKVAIAPRALHSVQFPCHALSFAVSEQARPRRRCNGGAACSCTVTTYGSSKKQRHAHHAAKKHSPILTSRVAQAHKAPVRVTMLDALSLHDLMHSPFVVPAQVSGGARVQHSGKSYEQRDGVVQSMVVQQMVRNMS